MYDLTLSAISKKEMSIIDTFKDFLKETDNESYVMIIIICFFSLVVVIATLGIAIPIGLIILKCVNMFQNTLFASRDIRSDYDLYLFEYKFFKNNYYRFYNEDFGLIGTKGSGFLKTKKLRKFYVSYKAKRKLEKLTEKIKEDGKERETTEEWKVLFDQLGVVNELVDKLNKEKEKLKNFNT